MSAGGKVVVRPGDPLRANPIAHDFIKACLTYNPHDIFSFCATLPAVKRSRIFLPGTPHRLVEARQEWFLRGNNYPADCVWVFYNGFVMGSYLVVHEIKTGSYDIHTEVWKHHIADNHVSLWIWAYKEAHDGNDRPPRTFVKKINIESLGPYLNRQVKIRLRFPGGDN